MTSNSHTSFALAVVKYPAHYLCQGHFTESHHFYRPPAQGCFNAWAPKV